MLLRILPVLQSSVGNMRYKRACPLYFLYCCIFVLFVFLSFCTFVFEYCLLQSAVGNVRVALPVSHCSRISVTDRSSSERQLESGNNFVKLLSREKLKSNGGMEKPGRSPSHLCLCFRLGLGGGGAFLDNSTFVVSSRVASSTFQASEVDEEEAEVPEESFTSTKEFKVSHQSSFTLSFTSSFIRTKETKFHNKFQTNLFPHQVSYQPRNTRF